jgi:hypothetical protein
MDVRDIMAARGLTMRVPDRPTFAPNSNAAPEQVEYGSDPEVEMLRAEVARLQAEVQSVKATLAQVVAQGNGLVRNVRALLAQAKTPRAAKPGAVPTAVPVTAIVPARPPVSASGTPIASPAVQAEAVEASIVAEEDFFGTAADFMDGGEDERGDDE